MQYGNRTDPASGQQLSDKERRSIVEAVANSATFQHSPILRSFFIYVSVHALAGRREEIKEQRIGWHVLGRKPDYDTANDNIVRIRARQVRQKLDEYFATEGRDSQWIIAIPKGGYAPVFLPRPESALHTDTETVAVHLDEEDVKPGPVHGLGSDHGGAEPAGVHESRVSIGTQAPWFVAGAAVLALCVVLWSRREVDPIFQPPVIETSGLWTQFFPTRGSEVTLVVADSGFAVWQNYTRRSQDLGDYVGRAFLREPQSNPSVRTITETPYTSLADVILTMRISEIARQFGGRVNVKHTRNVDIHDFSNGDVVLLGSRQSDPWVELFEPHMNFVLEKDPKLGTDRFRNRAPRPGEAEVFETSTLVADKGSEESYAVVAFVPRLAGTGHVLILEGLDMEGTEAAGEFVVNPERFAVLLQKAGITRDSKLKPFEALIKLRAIRGGFEALELMAFRYGQPTSKTS